MRTCRSYAWTLGGWVMGALWVSGFLTHTPSCLASADDVRPDFVLAAQRARESVVLVASYIRHPARPDRDLVVTNTGWFVDSEGHVLTSMLAVSGSARIEVRRHGAEPVEAHIWALDQLAGFVLLHTGLRETPALERRDEPAAAGQWVVVANGVPRPGGGAEIALCQGVLSSTEAEVKLSGVWWRNLLQGEIVARRGGAAAPVLDPMGRLVGVLLGTRISADNCACSYALAVRELNPILSGLVQRQSRRQGWLGVAVGRSPDMEGLTVRGVLEGSPAHAAGIRPGDVLLALDGEPIVEPTDFECSIAIAVPGSGVDVRLLRGQEVMTVPANLGARPVLISRLPLAARHEIQVIRHGFSAPGPGMELEATSHELLLDLQRKNRELREAIRRLEERLDRIEGKAGESQ